MTNIIDGGEGRRGGGEIRLSLLSCPNDFISSSASNADKTDHKRQNRLEDSHSWWTLSTPYTDKNAGQTHSSKTACLRQVLLKMGLDQDRLINFQVCKDSCNTTFVSSHIRKFFTLPSVVIKRENFKLVMSGKNVHLWLSSKGALKQAYSSQILNVNYKKPAEEPASVTVSLSIVSRLKLQTENLFEMY